MVSQKQKPIIVQIALATPLRRLFDYIIPDTINTLQLQPGIRVKVPFGRRKLIGILIKKNQHSTLAPEKLKEIIEIIDEQPVLTAKQMALNEWIADYYHHSIGEVMLSSLPKLLRQGKAVPTKLKINPIVATQQPKLILNAGQQQAFDTIISKTGFNTFLLDGVTGSGKTEIYLQLIEHTLNANKQALILVPEISLTPQTIARFQERFAVPIVTLHSHLNDTERLHGWTAAKTEQASIVIGTRSAIFTPFAELGIIILDEEHDLSFKQQTNLRYSAKDLAIKRAQLENIPVVLGSATTSLESAHNALKKRFHYLHLPERTGTAIQPMLHILDMRNQPLEEGLTPQLLTAIQKHITQGGQVLLFLNRRGFAPVLLCHHCGWTAKCQRCDARMVLHQNPWRLTCHHCSATQKKSTHCPACQQKELLTIGLGTERLEEALNKYFPKVKCTRIDRDTTRRKGAMQKLLNEVINENVPLLIGTQMLAKGHHFPNVTMVAILDIDGGLLSADFRGSERMAQLLIQVAGRAGRAEKAGEVYIQTHQPQHPLLLQLKQENYQTVINTLLQERQAAQWPPYTYLALFRAEAVTENAPITFLNRIHQRIQAIKIPGIQLFGPVHAVMHRKAGRYRAQLLLQAKHRKQLHELLKLVVPAIETFKSTRGVRWSLDVDPLEMD